MAPVQKMIAFIDDHRAVHGVEPICKLLPIAPSTYHAHLAKCDNPAKLSDRTRRDTALRIEVRRVNDANFRVYGVRKIWRQLWREAFDIARCTVARPMSAMGLAGVILGKPVRTPSAIARRHARWTGSTASSTRRHPVGIGSRTSPTFGTVRVTFCTEPTWTPKRACCVHSLFPTVAVF